MGARVRHDDTIEILATADGLVAGGGARPGGWPRIVAVLARHAIEEALRQYWRLRQPGLERCSARAQLLCLDAYLTGDAALAGATAVAWSSLSRTCHHHPYELAPTAEELNDWLAIARKFAVEVARQTEAARLGEVNRGRAGLAVAATGRGGA